MLEPVSTLIHTKTENALPTTRLAPSPTGALHLGNARTFLVNWALARQRGWRIVLRIEDLDGPRVKPEAVTGIVETLRWLGMDWDEGPLTQSQDLEPCRAAMRSLAARGCAYRCDLSRSEIEAAASAPHPLPPAPEGAEAGPHATGETVFPASLRPPSAGAGAAFDAEESNWRFLVHDGVVPFDDEFAGRQERNPSCSIGDFVLWTKRAMPAYQLAVVVDDHRQGVTHVVRGDDLLDSVARQLLIYRALGLGPEPAYCHLPLVVGPDGRRLAKRHGDTRVDTYRAAGIPPERIIGLVAHWCGLTPSPRPCSAADLVSMLRLAAMPRQPIGFMPEHDAWLRDQRPQCTS